jgi:hypothetical protein
LPPSPAFGRRGGREHFIIPKGGAIRIKIIKGAIRIREGL